MPKNVIYTHNLNLGYKQGKKEKSLLSDLKLNMREGELVALIGENGSGKSTLLKTLSGQLPALNGKVEFFGKDIKLYSKHELASKLSFIGTEWPVVANMTIFQLVAMARYPYTNYFNKLNKKDLEIVEEAIHDVGLSAIKNSLITQISDGEKQRAMIAHSLAQDTPVIFLDEPTAFLDLSNKFEIVHLLFKLCRYKKKSILLSIHDIHIALDEADKIWLIDHGKMRVGAPEDLVLQNSIEQTFHSENVRFNYRSGLFYVKRKSKANICLKGEGRVYNWTKRALLRNEFTVNCNNQDNSVVVEAKSENQWKIKRENDEILCNSIYDLSFNLQQLNL